MIPESFEIREVYVGKCGRCDGAIPRADWNFCPYCGYCVKGNVPATGYEGELKS